MGGRSLSTTCLQRLAGLVIRAVLLLLLTIIFTLSQLPITLSPSAYSLCLSLPSFPPSFVFYFYSLFYLLSAKQKIKTPSCAQLAINPYQIQWAGPVSLSLSLYPWPVLQKWAKAWRNGKNGVILRSARPPGPRASRRTRRRRLPPTPSSRSSPRTWTLWSAMTRPNLRSARQPIHQPSGSSTARTRCPCLTRPTVRWLVLAAGRRRWIPPTRPCLSATRSATHIPRGRAGVCRIHIWSILLRLLHSQHTKYLRLRDLNRPALQHRLQSKSSFHIQ